METYLVYKVRKQFTLIELLVVIGIMVIIAGIGVKGYKRMSGEMALHLAETQVRQVVTSTILEAKRNRIPMQVQVYIPQNKNTESCVVSGGSGSMVGYWGFDGDESKNGLRGVKFTDNIKDWGGYYGKGAEFEKGNGGNPIEAATPLFDFANNIYMEVMVKPRIENILDAPNKKCIVLNGNEKLKLVLDGRSNSGLEIGIQEGNAAAKYLPGYFPDDGQWHKVGVFKSENKCSIYIDENLIGDIDVTAEASSIAAQMFTIGENYDGILDEIKIYAIGQGVQVSLDPRDTYLSGDAVTINITPFGTIENEYAIQVTSTRLNGSLNAGVPDKNLAGLDIKKIRSSVPQSGYMNFGDKELVQYEWSGDKKLRIIDDTKFGTENSTELTFNVVRPIVIKTDGAVQ